MAAVQPIKIPITAIDRTKKAFASVTRSLNAVRKSLLNFKTGLAAAFGVGGLGLLVKNSLDGIDTISKLSRTLGISVEDLRKLELAAALSNIELRTLTRGVRTLNKGMVDFARDGTGEAADAFEALNITADDINAVMGDQFKVLELVAKRLDEVENSAVRSSIAQELFGGRASELLLVLEDGGRELAKISKEAETFGLILSTSAAQGVEEANDAFTRLFSVVKGVTDTLTAALAPAFQAVADEARDALINKIQNDFGSVEKFGQAMAINVIEFLKAMSKAVIEFANTVITRFNSVLSFFNDIKMALSNSIAAEEVEAQVQKVINAFENFDEATKTATGNIRTLMDEVAVEMADLANGGARSTKELLALADALDEIGRNNGSIAITNQLSALLREAARKSEKTTDEFLRLGKITLDLSDFFDNLLVPLKNAKTGIDDVGDSAGKTGEAVRNLNGLKYVFQDIPSDVRPVIDAFASMRISLEDVTMRGVRSLEDALVDVGTQTKTLSQAFSDMARSVLADLMRMQIRQAITIPLANAMGLTPDKNAIGGSVSAGKPTIVGERGPELFIPGSNGGIIPNNRLGGGGVVVNQTINLTTGVSQTVRAEVMNMLPQIADAAKGAVLDAKRRGGSYAAALG